MQNLTIGFHIGDFLIMPKDFNHLDEESKTEILRIKGEYEKMGGNDDPTNWGKDQRQRMSTSQRDRLGKNITKKWDLIDEARYWLQGAEARKTKEQKKLDNDMQLALTNIDEDIASSKAYMMKKGVKQKTKDALAKHIAGLEASKAFLIAKVPTLKNETPTTNNKTATNNMVQISHNTAKNGIELTTPDKLSDTTLRGIKSLGFSWSKYQKIWYATYSPQLLEKIEQLLGVSAVNTTTTTTTETPKAAAPKEATKTTEPIQESKNAKAFFKTAESLQKKADAIYKNCSTKLTNTRKRMDEYNHAISQADTLAEKSKMYAAMGKAWENDNVPEVLKNITPIASGGAFSGYTKPGYNTYGSTEKRGYEYKTGAELEKAKKIFAAITALMNNANPKNEKEEQEKAKNIEIKKLENEVRFQKIDGFFPTPKTICNQMVELADIQPNDTILEPSAGIGSIAEAIRENYPNNKLDVCEWMYNLREILTLKGFNVVGEDTFKLKGKYDVIIMNPPFEKGADIDHVTFCYNNLLAPGGKLVAIMGEGAFSRSAKHDKDFQSWYVDVLEYEKKLDGNTFKGIEAFKQTGVNTRLIVLQKEGTKAKTTPKEQLPLGKRGRNSATTKHIQKVPLKRVKEIASTNDYSTTKIKDTIAINNIRGKGRKKITNNTRTKHKPLTPIRQGATTNPIPQASKYNTVEKSDITAIKGLLQSTAVPVAPNAIYEYKKIKTKQPEIKGEGSITGDKLLGEYAKANVYLVPLHDISINRALFQNREAAFSQRTVTNITDAVHNGEFHLEVMDPLLLWRTKINGKIVMYILAGHSRYQSFGVLNQEGAKVKGFDFSTIPCRILDGVSAGGVDEKTAMYLARISNNLATPETTTERVEYYQSLLKAKTDPKEVMKEIKKNEDKNATAIKNLVHLNPKGKTYQAYQQLGTGTGTNEAQVKNIATMIGNVRASNPNLTNQHEDEMWDYLYTKKKYGTQSSQINSVTELKDKVDRAAKSAGIEKDSSKPLNIANLKEISDTEREYQKEKKGALDALNQAEKERRDKQLKYSLDLAVEKKKQQNAKKERGENTRLTDTEEKALDEKYRKAMAPSWQKIDGLARIYRDVLLRGADVERLAKMENAMFA